MKKYDKILSLFKLKNNTPIVSKVDLLHALRVCGTLQCRTCPFYREYDNSNCYRALLFNAFITILGEDNA